MIIDIFQDTICPWCRIGKQNLLTAIEQWDGEPITMRYRSFFLDPRIPKEGLPFREAMAAIKGPEGLDEMFDHVTSVGAAVGLTFRFDRVEYKPNTLDSHQLIKLAPDEKQTEMVEAIYKAYFEDGKDIGNLDVLIDIAQQQGLDGIDVKEKILTGEMQEDIEEDLILARELQVSGVPFFVIDGKLALSGAHPAENFLKAFRQVSTME